MTAAERAYRFMLRAYPRAFRAAYGREMMLVFNAQRHDAGSARRRFWTELVLDVIRSAPALRMEALRTQQPGILQHEEGIAMKMTMGIAALMTGALETMNALQEVWGAGVVNHDTRALLAGTIAMVAGALLIMAGASFLRRSPGATALGRGAAITSLLVFTFLAAFVPLLSRFAILLGIAFPIAMLVFLRWGSSRGAAAPAVS